MYRALVVLSDFLAYLAYVGFVGHYSGVKIGLFLAKTEPRAVNISRFMSGSDPWPYTWRFMDILYGC